MLLQTVLERLVTTIDTVEKLPIRPYLLPGIPRSTVDFALQPLGIQAPEELYQLYEWRNGFNEDDSDPETPWLFLDYQFLGLNEAVELYLRIIEVMKSIRESHPEISEPWYEKDLFPFASFQNQYCFLYCGEQQLFGLQHPVIGWYSVPFVQFETIASAAQTCIEWYQAGLFGTDNIDLKENIRMRNNPRLASVDDTGLD